MKEDLLTIPGVGKEMKEDLIRLGYHSVSSLKGFVYRRIKQVYQRGR